MKKIPTKNALLTCIKKTNISKFLVHGYLSRLTPCQCSKGFKHAI